MALSNLVALFIILTTAATLHAHGVTNVTTSSQAAEALRPIAGPYVFLVFALGIIGTGMLAVPVLAGSAAYAMGEAFGWHVGLARKPRRAKAFYATIVAALVIGAALNFTPIDPVKALFWSAVINGVVAVPVMAMMMHLATHKAAMGQFTLPPLLRAVGWAATVAMQWPPPRSACSRPWDTSSNAISPCAAGRGTAKRCKERPCAIQP